MQICINSYRIVCVLVPFACVLVLFLVALNLFTMTLYNERDKALRDAYYRTIEQLGGYAVKNMPVESIMEIVVKSTAPRVFISFRMASRYIHIMESSQRLSAKVNKHLCQYLFDKYNYYSTNSLRGVNRSAIINKIINEPAPCWFITKKRAKNIIF